MPIAELPQQPHEFGGHVLVLGHHRARPGRVDQRHVFKVGVEEVILQVIDGRRPAQRLDVSTLKAVQKLPRLFRHGTTAPVAPHRPLWIRHAVAEVVDRRGRLRHPHFRQVLAQ